jgi:hypothetical protein
MRWVERRASAGGRLVAPYACAVKVFISWSGDQARSVAETLKSWLETVLAGRVSAWISSQDIAKGERGLAVIGKELEAGTFGLVVVTRSNAQAPWINFEAGALGKSLGEARVATALVDLTPADLAGPLAQFQATALSDRSDVLKLVKDIATAAEAGASTIPDETIELLFASKWPELEAAIAGAVGGEEPTTERPDKEILEEVLELVRGLARERAANAAVQNAYLTDRSISEIIPRLAREADIAAVKANERAADTVARVQERKMEAFRAQYGGDVAVVDGEPVGKIVNWDAQVDGRVFALIKQADTNRPTLKVPVSEIEIVSDF